MKLTDAAQLLNLDGDITPGIVKTADYTMAKLYHPDVNAAGEEMMKIIVDAYETLKTYTGSIAASMQRDGRSYPEALADALNAIIATPLDIEICGAWVWVSGNTFLYKSALRAAGYKWGSGKKKWYFRPDDWKSSARGSTSMDSIRHTYGSHEPTRTRRHMHEEEVAA